MNKTRKKNVSEALLMLKGAYEQLSTIDKAARGQRLRTRKNQITEYLCEELDSVHEDLTETLDRLKEAIDTLTEAGF